jgi:predicted dehydrogenase/threonine dehydrogenase-like Zn-dependent dehydrogenase
MKQVLQSYRDGELWLAETPAPALQPGGVIVQTTASVISAGTERMLVELARKSLLGKARARPDLVKKVLQKIKTEGLTSTIGKVRAKLDTPVPLGYSCAGTVLEVGADVPDLKVGDRVACAGAGYANHAECNYVPRNLCARIPDGVSDEDAAFTTIGAIALQGVRQAAPELGERVVVIGLGLLGLLTVQLLKANGCLALGFDPDAARCEKARELGADEATAGNLVEQAMAFSRGRGVDAVIITAATPSNEPIESAADICRVRGRVVVVGMVGLHVPRDPFYHKELALKLSMSYGPGRYDPDYEEAGRDYPYGYVRWTEQRNMLAFLDLVRNGSLRPGQLITRCFPIDNALEAYRQVAACAPQGEKVLAAVLTYPGAARSEPPPRRLDIRASAPVGRPSVGMIGAGSFARSVLLPELKRIEGVRLRGVCTLRGMRASETARASGFEYATTDPEAIFGDADIDTVFIVTGHTSHAELVLAALDAGKHVYVEKPLAVNAGELDALEGLYLGLPENRRPVLTVGFNRRFSKHTAALSRVFGSRTTPLMIQYRVNAGLPPSGVPSDEAQHTGGRTVGELCHFVDLCEHLTHAAPVRVHAAGITPADRRYGVDDTLAVTIEYDDGSLAAIQYGSLGSPALAKERIECHAGGISAVCEDFRETRFYGSRETHLSGRQEKGFAAEVAAFVDAVRHGGQLPIPFDSMLRTARVTFAVREALRNRAIITL